MPSDAEATSRPFKLAYSYSRFSSRDQIGNDSLRRQNALIEAWLDRNPEYVLDDSLTDKAVSAFRGRNIHGDGPLAKFLRAVEVGQVQEGSVLLLESLDRLSRQSPWECLEVFRLLIRNGITVVCLMDNRVYDEATMVANPFAIMESLLIMTRAHEESRAKSARLSANWAERRRKAAESGHIITGRAPGWLTVRDTKEGRITTREWVVKEERAEVVRGIYRMAAQGMGQEAIARALNAKGIPNWGNGKKVGAMWMRPHIKALLKSRAPGGYYTPQGVGHDENGKPVRKAIDGVGEIAGYFPKIVDDELFTKVHAMLLTDGVPLVRQGERSTLAGLCQCARCGSMMTRVSKGKNSGAKVRLLCTRAKLAKGCEYETVRIEEVEKAVLDNVPNLALAQPEATEVEAEADQARDVLELLDKRVSNLTRLVRDNPSEALVRELRDAEQHQQVARLELNDRVRRAQAAQAEFVNDRLGELWELSEAEQRDAPAINATLRQLLDSIVVNISDRRLTLAWKAGSTTDLPF